MMWAVVLRATHRMMRAVLVMGTVLMVGAVMTVLTLIVARGSSLLRLAASLVAALMRNLCGSFLWLATRSGWLGSRLVRLTMLTGFTVLTGLLAGRLMSWLGMTLVGFSMLHGR